MVLLLAACQVLEAFLVLEASPVPVELPHMVAVMMVLRLKRWTKWKPNKPHKYIEVLYAQFFSLIPFLPIICHPGV